VSDSEVSWLRGRGCDNERPDHVTVSVLARPFAAKRLALIHKATQHVLADYLDIVEVVEPLHVPRVVPTDIDDDQVIAAAVAAGAVRYWLPLKVSTQTGLPQSDPIIPPPLFRHYSPPHYSPRYFRSSVSDPIISSIQLGHDRTDFFITFKAPSHNNVGLGIHFKIHDAACISCLIFHFRIAIW
jgi:hypothetical protein